MPILIGMSAGKRPPFQFYLSTAFVLMLASAVLLLLNLKLHPADSAQCIEMDAYGWPFNIIYIHYPGEEHQHLPPALEFSVLGLALNVLCLLGMVWVTLWLWKTLAFMARWILSGQTIA